MNDQTVHGEKININGLTEEEVRTRAEQGLSNRADISTDRTAAEIVRSNTFTYFNLIFAVITVLLCSVGSFRSLTFLPVVIGNTLIGIFQEIRAKQVLDKMNILNAPHAVVIRDGERRKIVSEELVQDDTVFLAAGNQICADAVVVQGSVQVNEALLTGEADEIEKSCGDKLLSGSFVVAGSCYAKLEHVGKESYISKLTAEAKALGNMGQSEMIRSVNQLVKWIGIVIIPIGAVLFCQGYFFNHETFQKSIVSMVAALIGMIPEGLYLLTTIALALGTIRLAKRQVLLHDMKSIEALARVDILCVDKTGTITETAMQVTEFRYAGNRTPEEVDAVFSDYIAAVEADNETMKAVREYLNTQDKDNANRRAPQQVIPFSSATKYSGVEFAFGSFVLGAPEFVMREGYAKVEPQIAPDMKKGYRVLVFGEYKGSDLKEGLTDAVEPLGYVILTNAIRENAVATFSYFREQGVAVKVISGDNPETVSEVARCAGIERAERFVDAGTLDTDEKLKDAAERYTVFGRVTPKQKQKLVQALKGAGHTVAMTGDGVNDILAMKDADCSIAMASGSEAAAQAAQVVLLDSDFAHMPDVVLEGRRVVNNVQRSASLFLVKNIFSLLMALFAVVTMITYPLEPSQVSLISMFTIGLPGFLLALEPNKERIRGRFLKNVLLRALPAGLTDVLVVAAFVTCGKMLGLSDGDISTAGTLLLAVVGFMILIKISAPFNRMKYGILAVSVFGLAFCGIFLHELFAVRQMSRVCVLLLIVFSLAAESLFRYLSLLVEWLDIRYKRHASG